MKNYTAEQLSKNYDKFIDALKKVFKGERLTNLLHMYSEKELGQELAIAPASGRLQFHSAYAGGYIDHVLNVARNAFKLKKVYEEGGVYTNAFYVTLTKGLGFNGITNAMRHYM